ncbi:uncharacterized protein LOC133177034 [Saccostrea echinata]|uniref:uncharacterized protein LOC133177034 n=1 Tax=Saccostrea echinata TaxID=191078 RepID=UPI002A824021|nr:uncharacterized protein LOC133177034 [Saccostrea echinata]
MKVVFLWNQLTFVGIIVLDFFLYMTDGSSFFPHLSLNLTSLCNDEAIFEALPKYSIINSSCTILYNHNRTVLNDLNNGKVTYRFNASSNIFRIPLNGEHVLYNVELKCMKNAGSTMQYSNSVDKITAACHRDQEVITTTESEVIYKEHAIFSSSVQDIVLGIVFSVLALLIVFVTVYYQYRRYRRQRRMQQYLSTPHTDPFERLQDHMEE